MTKTESETLQTKVKSWLETEGYPLEFRTAEALRQHGFSTEQGLHISDRLTEKLREIDLLAATSVGDDIIDGFAMSLLLVVECKWSADHPWVVFSAKSGVRSSRRGSSFAMAQSCLLAQATLWALAKNPAVTSSPLFRLEDRSPFGVRRAFKAEGTDQSYAAVQAVIGASSTVVTEMRKRPPDHVDFENMYIVRPVVVAKARLFEAYLDSEQRDLVVTPRSWARLPWSGSLFAPAYSIVDIVTEDGLDDYLCTMKKALSELFGSVRPGYEAVTRSLSASDLSPVHELRGDKRTTRLPQLLEHLVK